MYVLIDDEFDDEVDAEICEVIESSVVTMKGDTQWIATMGQRMVDMEETKQWFVQIDGVNGKGEGRSMLKIIALLWKWWRGLRDDGLVERIMDGVLWVWLVGLGTVG